MRDSTMFKEPCGEKQGSASRKNFAADIRKYATFTAPSLANLSDLSNVPQVIFFHGGACGTCKVIFGGDLFRDGSSAKICEKWYNSCHHITLAAARCCFQTIMPSMDLPSVWHMEKRVKRQSYGTERSDCCLAVLFSATGLYLALVLLCLCVEGD